ncbi:MAG: hypothetical protein HY920_06945, partial [Elusimicrobia bacterium]|nr:hypothetical protein [Elusimicrobiota bacterium]
MKLNAKIILSTFLLGIFSIFSANLNPASADLADNYVAEGKTLLLEEYEVYKADAKFADALLLNLNHEKANFWRALTISMTNADLKAELVDMGLFDVSDNLIALDKEDELRIGYSVVDDIIIDNQDITAGYSEEGTGWADTVIEGAYGDDCRGHAAGIGLNKAIWTFSIPVAGVYGVNVWWPYFSDNSTDAKFTIFYDGGSQTITKNQRQNGGRWMYFGGFNFSPGAEARVELSDDTSTGKVVADAVRLEFDAIILDADTTYASFFGSWTDQTHSSASNGSYKEIAAGSGGTCTWTLPITLSSRYQLYARWAASDSNATDAVFEVRVNGGLVASIPVDQQHDNLRSISLGLFEFQSTDSNTVTLLQNSGGKVTTDGIELIPVRTLPTLSEFQSIQTSTLTQIDQAIGYLNKVTSGFQDTADFGATDDLGNPVMTELDYGDALLLKGIFYLFKSELNSSA